MAITVIVRKETHELKPRLMVKEAMEQLGLSPETHLAVRNGELLTENEVLKEGDVVKIIAAISGGSISPSLYGEAFQ